MKTALVVALLSLAVLHDVPATAGVRALCRLLCQEEIGACTLESEPAFLARGFGPGRAHRVAKRRCRQMLMQRCIHDTINVCVPASTTTTTTTTNPPIITPTTMTTTTTTRPPFTTTSTTLVSVLNAAGVWSFSGSLLLNDCGLDVDAFVSSTITVRQSGTLLSGTMGTLVATGDILGPDSWEMSDTPTCSGTCCTGSAVRATSQVDNHANGVIVIVSLCTSGLQCGVGYGGTMNR